MFLRFIYRIALRFFSVEMLKHEMSSALRIRMEWARRDVAAEFDRRGLGALICGRRDALVFDGQRWSSVDAQTIVPIRGEVYA